LRRVRSPLLLWLITLGGTAAAAVAVTGAGAGGGREQLRARAFPGSPEHPAMEYDRRPAEDAVAKLNQALQAGTIQPRFDDDSGPGLGSGSGYLRALLDALAVPVESQMLVFSKTGVQQAHTSPANPRALFFNDSVAIGYIRGAPFLEIASHDPHQGVIFYTLAQSRVERPTLQRRDQCLSCHVSRSSLDIPGMLVRSNFTEPDGSLLPHLGSHIIDHRSPFDERWGGWYVTGTHGSMRHLGNAIVLDPARPDAASAMVTRDTLNLPSVARHFDTRSYLSPYSDIVALMVFEHQMHMINLITRVRLGSARRRRRRPHGGSDDRRAARRDRRARRLPAVRGRGAADREGGRVVRIRRAVRGARTARQQGTLAAAAGSQHAPDALSVQLYDSLRRVRQPAGQREGRHLPPHVADPLRARTRMRATHPSRPPTAARSSRSCATRSRPCRSGFNSSYKSRPTMETRGDRSTPWLTELARWTTALSTLRA
jgi:hypothetical protein